MYRPLTFPGQQPNESIVVVLHRHWWVFIRQAIQVIVLGALPLLIFILVKTWTSISFETGSILYVLLVMGSSLYYLFLTLLLYNHWLDYALDVFIISDKRVVDIQQSNLFNRTVAEQRLYRVQDVTFEVNGVIRTFLKYGNVYIQTAAERQRFIFKDVPNPDKVTELLLKLVDKARREEIVDDVEGDDVPRAPVAPNPPAAPTPTPPAIRQATTI